MPPRGPCACGRTLGPPSQKLGSHTVVWHQYPCAVSLDTTLNTLMLNAQVYTLRVM
jgi:hypothetical protein